jgi:hypothetical protein
MEKKIAMFNIKRNFAKLCKKINRKDCNAGA